MDSIQMLILLNLKLVVLVLNYGQYINYLNKKIEFKELILEKFFFMFLFIKLPWILCSEG